MDLHFFRQGSMRVYVNNYLLIFLIFKQRQQYYLKNILVEFYRILKMYVFKFTTDEHVFKTSDILRFSELYKHRLC